jgi:glycosyltransferase involved in cell wall biosynthesis
VVVVPNGVDARAFAPTPDSGRLRRELGVPPETPIIGSIGRLEPVKGYEVSVDAYRLLRGEWRGGPPPLLVVAGDGSERPRLEARARASGAGEGVRFLGWRDDLGDLLPAFTIFTMSSHSEGTSVSLLEAMSAGRCPVVTDVGGNAAVLGPALGRRLVAPGDPAALARAWREALSDAAGREADAQAARARVLDAFTIDAMVRGYARVHRGDPGRS